MYKKVALCAAISMSVFASSAYATDETTTFTVQAIVTADCAINLTGGNVDFGTLSTLQTASVASTTVDIACTNGTPYTVGVNNGTNNDRRLHDPANTGPNDYITYQVNQTVDINTPVTFANLGTSTVGSTGTGITTFTQYPIYVALPSQTAPTPGTYTDTLTVGVRY